MALKLDMSKAYDRLEWGYLRAVLERMGFAGRWINLVMQYVSSVTYKLVHERREMGPFFPFRSMRQGDPISPYLFIICDEGFSSLLKKYEIEGKIKGCRVARGAPIVSHMLFADDSYVYCKANEQDAANVMHLLRAYEMASGQKINSEKSSIFFSSNTEVETRDMICGLMNIFEDDDEYL